jgi:Fic family protein
MGRLWQTLILFRWNPMFAHIPIERLVHEHQAEYYQTLQQSTAQTGNQSIAVRYADELEELRPQPMSSKGAQA